MLMRFDPFRDVDRLTEQIWGGTRSAMPMDAYRRDDQFLVHFDLPGVDPDSIELTVERNVLTVTARREWRRSEGVEVIAAERPQGTFTRQLFLGDGLDADHIEASYDGGVLTVLVPVADQAKPRKIEVTSSGGTQQIEASTSAA